MGKTIEQQVEVMEAFNKGARVQLKKLGTDLPWEDITEPSWNWGDFDYRVKPSATEEIPESIEDQQKMVREFLEKCKTPVFDYIVKWLADSTQALEINGYMKQSDITYDYLKENEPDLISEILSTEPADPGNMTDDEVEECARYWMNRASYDDIINMIKDEA